MGELATVKDPRKAFPVGKKLRVRVVSVIPHQHTLVCTNKRSLLREDAPLVCDLTQTKQGDEVVGVVKELRDNGVFFRFFNQITGFLPVIELQRRNVRAEDLFKPGRVARVRVSAIDLARNRMLVLPVEGSVDETRELSGKVLSGVVVKTDVRVAVYGKETEERGVVLHLEDDMYAFLPVGVGEGDERQEKQISDHPDLNGRLLRLFTEGSRINELGVLDIIPKGRYSRSGEGLPRRRLPAVAGDDAVGAGALHEGGDDGAERGEDGAGQALLRLRVRDERQRRLRPLPGLRPALRPSQPAGDEDAREGHGRRERGPERVRGALEGRGLAALRGGGGRAGALRGVVPERAAASSGQRQLRGRGGGDCGGG